MDEIRQRTSQALEMYNAELKEDATLDHAAIIALVEAGVDVHQTDNNSNTLLHFAARFGHLEVCKNLLEQGADTNAGNQWKNTPLHLAAWWKKTIAARYLLAQGTNVWAKDNHETRAFEKDNTLLLKTHLREWVPKLKAVKDGNCSEINNTQDLYHLTSVMQPSNPKNVPPPKEFIRTLFLQYIPHKPEFDTLYEAIFAETHPKELDLQSARKEAAKHGGVML